MLIEPIYLNKMIMVKLIGKRLDFRSKIEVLKDLFTITYFLVSVIHDHVQKGISYGMQPSDVNKETSVLMNCSRMKTNPVFN